MTEEILDIINDKDEILGHASYAKVHEEKLMHRVVMGFLFNKAGEILLQLRAKKKSAYPDHWSLSFGGHVSSGESYKKALVREAREEIGVNFTEKDFTYRGRGPFVEHAGAKGIYEMYDCSFDGPIEEHTEEVDAVQFVTFTTLKKMIHEKTEKIHPIMIDILEKFYSKELGHSA